MSFEYEPASEPLHIRVEPAARWRRRLVRTLVLEREFFIDNLLVRIHFIIVMIRWTGIAPWENLQRDGVAVVGPEVLERLVQVLCPGVRLPLLLSHSLLRTTGERFRVLVLRATPVQG